MAFTPAVGTSARVRTGAGSDVLSGAQTWRLQKTAVAIPLNHFELTADANSVVWQAFGVGLATATATVTGLYDFDATTKTEGGTPALKTGTTVTLDLLFTRTPFGYTDLSAILTGFETGATIENQGSNYTATFQITGVVAVAA